MTLTAGLLSEVAWAVCFLEQDLGLDRLPICLSHSGGAVGLVASSEAEK